jgi:hypothetical protein
MSAGNAIESLPAEGPAPTAWDLNGLRARLARVAPWLFVGLLALYHAQRDLHVLPARLVIPVLGLAFVLAVCLKLEDIVYGRQRVAGLALFVAGTLPALYTMSWSGRTTRALGLVPLLIGWGLYCALPMWPHVAERRADLSERTARRLVPAIVLLGALGAFAFMALNTTSGVNGDGVNVVDETLYLLQASAMGEPGFARHVDPALAQFFAVQQAVMENGRIYTQFPAGWPAILALFGAVGLRWWAGIAFGAASVFLTYLVGSRLHGRFVGTLAAALVATQGLFLTMAGSYMAHVPGAACALGAALLLLVGEDARGGRRAAAWLGAGFLLGLAVAIRPLTGVALALSLGLWILLRRRLAPKEVVTLAALLAAGSALPMAGLLYYNAATTGSPLRFGYQAVHGSLHDMGFGRRGMMLLDEHAVPRPVARDFSPRSSSLQLAGRAEGVASQLMAAFLVFPVLLVGLIYRYRYRWATIAAFFILPAVYFFYWFSDWRFYVELYPFALIGLAAVLYHVRQRDRPLGNALATFALAGAVVTTGFYLHQRATQSDRLHAYFDAVRDAQRQYGKVLVFAKSPLTNTVPFTWLYALNAGPAAGDIVVARDLGPENARLIARFPGYTPVRVHPYSDTSPLVTRLDDTGKTAR